MKDNKYRITAKFQSFTGRIELPARGIREAFDKVCEMTPIVDTAKQLTLRMV